MNFIASGATDTGLVKETNQDSCGVKILQTSVGKMAFAILCDGMGGYAKGEVASATVVKAFFNWIDKSLPMHSTQMIARDIYEDWEKLITEYNKKIGSYGRNNGITLGTTLTAILLTETQYFLVHVGDSRLYEISDNAILLLTTDQTVVAREVEAGILNEEQAKNDPRRSVLLQCVGASKQVSPYFMTGETKKDAVYMLCSDGFRHEITNEEIQRYLAPSMMCEVSQMKQNMETLIEINKQRQEQDNITVVSVRTY